MKPEDLAILAAAGLIGWFLIRKSTAPAVAMVPAAAVPAATASKDPALSDWPAFRMADYWADPGNASQLWTAGPRWFAQNPWTGEADYSK